MTDESVSIPTASRGSNDRNFKIAARLATMRDPNQEPAERLRAAGKYLSLIQPNKNNVPPLRAIIKLYETHSDQHIVESALKLKRRLIRALDLKSTLDPDAAIPGAMEVTDDFADPIPIGAKPDADEWAAEPPLSFAEQLRLLEVEKPFQQFGGDVKEMLTDALDGRPFTTETFQKLYCHLRDSFSAGGFVLCDGPLFPVLVGILERAGAAVPPLAPPRFTLIEKLRARD